jgi:putative endonuclease
LNTPPGSGTRPTDRGREAEERACRHLTAAGLRLLERNFNSRRGEIDLVMREGATLVFVEVRYRRSNRFGSGAESVDRRKMSRILAAARHYLQLHPGAADRPCRFDVVAIGPGDGSGGIDWIRDAFGTD